MSSLSLLAGTPAPKLYVEDVFSTYLYTGNGTTQDIVNGIDLAGKGGMVWTKDRSTGVSGHGLYDTTRGVNTRLQSQWTGAEGTFAGLLTSFNSNGFSIGNLTDINNNGTTFTSWTFRNAPKFFQETTKIHTTGTPSTVDLSSLGTVGMVEVKSTVGISNWFTWHKDLTAGNLVYLNLTNAQTADTSISVSGTTLTLSASLPSDTYVIYAYAHDTSADGIIQCGSFASDTGGNGTAELGWEPQYLMLRPATIIEGTYIFDSLRGLPISGNRKYLMTQSADAEGNNTVSPSVNSTGFSVNGFGPNSTVIYMAIRRPMKTPTIGTEVFNAIARTGTGIAATISGVGFSPDLNIIKSKSITGYTLGAMVGTRLTGTPNYLVNSDTTAEVAGGTGDITSIDMDGITIGGSTQINYGLTSYYINYFFKRAKGFMDIVAYTGTGVAGLTVNHNLGVAPEWVWIKDRTATNTWQTYSSSVGNSTTGQLNSTTDFFSTGLSMLNSTDPTSTVVTIGNSGVVNTSTNKYIIYLFATLPGISKASSYIGNGTSQIIDCGFTTGARFIIIKRVVGNGDWYIWDSVRGIVAGNDPHLSLNTTVAEITTDDSIDPNTLGFAVNQNATTNINVNLATYIFFAIA